MPRPKRDGTPAQAPNKRKLSALFINKIQPRERTFLIWDSHQKVSRSRCFRAARKAGSASIVAMVDRADITSASRTRWGWTMHASS
jgi:hypothetical protein